MSNSNHLILLGAGASYGSEPNKSIVPPLALDLFDKLLEFRPSLWRQIPSDIAAIYREDFEAGMLAVADKMPHALSFIQRSMGAFFYRYGPTPSSLYTKLAKQIRLSQWNGAIATLNYERMLQIALIREGCECVVGKAEESQIELCLPHGSCNLFCQSVMGNAGLVSFHGMNVTTNGPVTCIDHPDAFWPRIENDSFPPVMSYFEPKKFTTSGASFINSQRQRLIDLINNSKSIAVIGIQVREQDTHIWDALASTSAPIYYCAGPPGAIAYKSWKAKLHNKKRESDFIAKDYWSENFDAINSHVWIK